jgi:hypothetical protein
LIGLGAAVLVSAAALDYHAWRDRIHAARPDVLSYMPPEADTVIYADLGALRDSPFLAQLKVLAQSPGTDPEYADFTQATGFDYARDLDRAALAVISQDRQRVLFVVADGSFNHGKIIAYALKSGKREMASGRELFRTPLSGTSKWATFTFLSAGRMALTDGEDLGAFASYLTGEPNYLANEPWRERFARLAGSPVFLVSSLSGGNNATLTAHSVGGLRSEQLGTLAGSLRWGTVALRPDGDSLRVIAEAECASDDSARQLSGVASGLTLFAGAVLADPKTRRQLDPGALVALEEMLRTADVSRIDRGETKGVRLVFSVTSRALDAVRRLNRSALQ